MVSQESAVKKYIVTLSDAERKQLTALIESGKHPARKLLKARILLKADTSPDGAGWSDGEIAAALETSVDTVARTRQRLVEEGLEAALIRQHSPNSARRRIFDGAAEARLIALACSKPPAGFSPPICPSRDDQSGRTHAPKPSFGLKAGRCGFAAVVQNTKFAKRLVSILDGPFSCGRC